MTLIGSIVVMVGCAALAFLLGLVAVHFSSPCTTRHSLGHTFWQAVVRGDRYGLKRGHPPVRAPAGESSQFQSLAPPL